LCTPFAGRLLHLLVADADGVVEHQHLGRAGVLLDQLRDLGVVDALALGLVGEVFHLCMMVGKHETVGVEPERVAQRPAVADRHHVLAVLRRDFLVRHLRPVDIAHRRHAGVDDVVHLRLDSVCGLPFGHELHGTAPAMEFDCDHIGRGCAGISEFW
jgi:hypothetical protein